MLNRTALTFFSCTCRFCTFLKRIVFVKRHVWFFRIYISHELRTPLTLIITPLDMLKRKITDESVSRQLSNIYRNAQELLNLVNQLLDFRKLEMKGEKLLLMNGDLEEFLESIYNSFHPVAVEKHLDFTCRMTHQSLYMYFDKG